MERDQPNRRPRALHPDLEEEERNAIAKARRSHGTGSLYVHVGRNGRESWYARWYVAGRRVRRTLGLKRGRSQPDGLTRSEAEAEPRRLIQSKISIPARITVAEASERMLASLRTLGRKPTTLDTYSSTLDIHLLPPLGTVPMSEVGPDEVEAVLAAMEAAGKSPKTRANAFRLCYQLFRFAQRRGWCTTNLCEFLELGGRLSNPDFQERLKRLLDEILKQ